VEAEPGLPERQQGALKDHLLVQLSAIGLRVNPPEKIPVTAPESTGNRPNRAAAVAPKPRWEFDLDQSARWTFSF
jgi:hypothetical protein